MITYFILIASMPYMQHPIWNASIGGGLSVTKLVGGITVLYACVYLARRHSTPNYFATPQSKWMMLFIGIAFYSFLANEHAEFSLVNPMAMYASSALLFFVSLSVIDSLRRLYWSLMVAVGSIAFASLYMIREWTKGIVIYGSGFRPGWVLGDANYFTVAALVTLPLAFELFLLSPRRWQKLYCIGCLLLTFAAITLGASRGGFLGIVVDLGYLVLRSRNRVRNIVRLSLISLPFLMFAPNSPVHRFLHPVPGDTESTHLRLLGWAAGLHMVEAHPLTGVGLGNYKSVVSSYDTTGLVVKQPHIAHNAYVEVAAEMGIPALVIYLILFGSTFRSLEKTRKLALRVGDQLLPGLALGMQASLLGAWIAIFFVSGQYTKLFWFIMIITMCLPPLISKKASVKKQPPEPARGVEPSEELQVGPALVEMG